MILNKNIKFIGLASLLLLSATACKKEGCMDVLATNYNEEAKKDDGSCIYPTFEAPNTYTFTDGSGNNTVSYTGQIERLDQLTEMATYVKSGKEAVLSVAVMDAMFQNTGNNGGGNFTFTSTKQLRDKCLATDTAMFNTYFDELATASLSFSETASSGQAGTLTTGTSTYLFASNGMEYAQLIEKGLMGAVFLNQALNVYFGDSKMDVDNSTVVNSSGGEYYTAMEHHWDEAFGYFGAPIDFPTNVSNLRFWAKYCNTQNANLGSNAQLMNAFLKGRAAIAQKQELTIRDEQILIIRKAWEKLSASQAVSYLQEAKANFGTDNAKFLHSLSEAYAFILCLKYVPLETRLITYPQIETLLEENIGNDFWALSLVDLNTAISTLEGIYSL